MQSDQTVFGYNKTNQISKQINSLFPFFSLTQQSLLPIYIYLGTETLSLKLHPLKSLSITKCKCSSRLAWFCCLLALELILVKILDWIFYMHFMKMLHMCFPVNATSTVGEPHSRFC